MQHCRHVLRAYEDAKETDRSRAVVAAPMPVGPRLQERLARIAFVERSVGGELDSQHPLEHVDVALTGCTIHGVTIPGGMVTTFEEITGFGVEGYSRASPAIVFVSVDTSTKFAMTSSVSNSKSALAAFGWIREIA
jgi:hypothetical protein